MEGFIVNDNDIIRLNAIGLLHILLQRVKSLKLDKETVPLFSFFVNKLVDVVVTKEASCAIITILQNIFVELRYKADNN